MSFPTLKSLLQEKKKETAADAFARLEKFEKMLKAGNPGVTQDLVDNIRKVANSLMDSEMAAKLKSFESKHSGSDWWELAQKQYPITHDSEGYTVTSTIREWGDEKKWGPFPYKYQALEKIKQLVDWLNQGRKRGFGDRDADLEKWAKKIDSVAAEKQ